mgnify:FL=1|tara:strand:- start:1168 stop:1608 length:441 start_codon:yes stop_codon:yes gene_type:complete
MKLISHRGNISGVYEDLENTEDYIQKAIDLGYDVEIDVWYKDFNLYLGHDGPERIVRLDWLLHRSDKLWIHCKNFASLSFLSDFNLTLFFHEKEDYTIISNGKIWAHNLSNIDDKCVIPLLSKKDITEWTKTTVYGVCSDFINVLK